MTLDAEDILTDARLRTETLGLEVIPSSERAYDRAETAILLAPEPPKPAPQESLPRVNAPSMVAATEIAVERHRASRGPDRINIVLVVIGAVLVLIAVAIVVGAVSH